MGRPKHTCFMAGGDYFCPLLIMLGDTREVVNFSLADSFLNTQRQHRLQEEKQQPNRHCFEHAHFYHHSLVPRVVRQGRGAGDLRGATSGRRPRLNQVLQHQHWWLFCITRTERPGRSRKPGQSVASAVTGDTYQPGHILAGGSCNQGIVGVSSPGRWSDRIVPFCSSQRTPRFFSLGQFSTHLLDQYSAASHCQQLWASPAGVGRGQRGRAVGQHGGGALQPCYSPRCGGRNLAEDILHYWVGQDHDQWVNLQSNVATITAELHQ